MPKASKFHYNQKNLRFERVRISILNVSLAAVSYLAFGALFFAGLVLLQNYLFETPLEKKLRAENNALQSYKTVLASQLNESNRKLNSLKSSESELYSKLFEIKKPEPSRAKPHREEILLSSTSAFFDWAQSIETQYAEWNKKASTNNYLFASNTHVDKKEVERLACIPSVPPVENFQVNQLVSGYGTRVNPFHKGLYHHDGLDIAAPTGTLVLAGGTGKIIAASNSSMVGGYGNYIEIDHGQGIISRYSHLGEIKVMLGQKVKQGQVIALMGVSGGSVGPHVHYEVMKNGLFLNPVKFMIAGLNSTQYNELVVKSSNQNQSLD